MKSRERLSLVIDEDGFSHGDEFSCFTIAEGSPTPEGWEDNDWPISMASRVDRLTELKLISGIKRLDPNAEIEVLRYQSSR